MNNKTFTSLSFILFFLAQSVFAFPTVGDRATLSGTQNGANVSVTDEVIEVPSGSDYIAIKHTTTANGNPSVEDDIISLSALEIFMHMADSVKICAKVGTENEDTGIIEKIKIGSAVIQTCHIHGTFTTDDGSPATGDEWYGNVPFGVVKTSSSGSASAPAYSLTLTSFTNF